MVLYTSKRKAHWGILGHTVQIKLIMTSPKVYLKWMLKRGNMLKGWRQPNSTLRTHIDRALSAHAHTHFPRQQVIQQTLLADWNRERINSRWYHWEKMEHIVENTPCQATTGRHNQQREQTLGMRCNREATHACHTMYNELAQEWSRSPRVLSDDDICVRLIGCKVFGQCL